MARTLLKIQPLIIALNPCRVVDWKFCLGSLPAGFWAEPCFANLVDQSPTPNIQL